MSHKGNLQWLAQLCAPEAAQMHTNLAWSLKNIHESDTHYTDTKYIIKEQLWYKIIAHVSNCMYKLFCMFGVFVLPVSDAGTLFVSMLSVMTLKMLIDSIIGITTKQN